jgi:hypothetical protein
MKRRNAIGGVIALSVVALLPSIAAASALPKLAVFKDPNCGCCTGWADHMKAAGFDVHISEATDLVTVRKRLGMPEQYAGCHSGSVDGYALEGHVPAADVKRLLASRPKVIGLSVLGMPVGSPGMEMGGRTQPYQVLLIGRDGQSSVFARYG